MLRKLLTAIVLIGITSSLLGCTEKPAVKVEKAPVTSGEAIVLGDISFEPEYRIRRFQPIADYLATNLGDIGIGKGEVKIASDKDTMAKWMASGEVDLYFDSLFPAMFAIDQSGAKAILRRWKDGVEEYNTVFIIPSDSNLTSLADLKGKMIALQDPNSTSGYMMPLVYLIKAGINPVEKAEPNHPVAKDKVGYVFGGKDAQVLLWVVEGKVAAGVVDSETFKGFPEETRSKLKILAETEKFPRQVVVARPGMDPKRLEAIKTVLMDMDEKKEGKALLKEFKNTAQFDEFPEGAEAALAKMRESYKLVREHETKQDNK